MASRQCEKHDQELISSVCITHCQLTCIKCVLEDHRHCSEVSTLKDATESYATKLNRCINKHRENIGILSSRTDKIQNILTEVDTMHADLEREIRSLFSNLQLRLDACKAASLDELRSIVAAKKQEPNDIIENLGAMIQSLDKSLTDLQQQDVKKITDKSLSYLKQTEESVSHMESSDFIEAEPKTLFQVSFKCAKLLENILDSDLRKLGTIYCGDQHDVTDISPPDCLSSDKDQNIRCDGASLSTAQSDEQTGAEELEEGFEYRVDRFDKGTGNPLLKYIDDYGTLYVMQSKAHHIYSDSWKTYMGTPGRTPVDKKSLFRADVAFTLTSDPTDLVKGIKSDTVLAEIGLCKESCFDAANVMGNLDGAWTFQLVYLASPNIFSLQACTGGNVVDKVELDLNVITFMKCGGMYKWFVDMPKNEMYIEPGHEFGKQYRLKIANIECLNKYCLYSVFGVFRDGVAVGLQST